MEALKNPLLTEKALSDGLMEGRPNGWIACGCILRQNYRGNEVEEQASKNCVDNSG